MNILKKIKNLFTAKRKPSGCCGGGCCGHQNAVLDIQKDLNLNDNDMALLPTIDPKIVIGRVDAVASHPNPKMTKVRVTQTCIGDATEQILCGGTNVAEGIIVAVATVGAKLGEDFTIGEREIRGEMSRGMICARAELGLSPAGEEKGQIWILPASYEKMIGVSLSDL